MLVAHRRFRLGISAVGITAALVALGLGLTATGSGAQTVAQSPGAAAAIAAVDDLAIHNGGKNPALVEYIATTRSAGYAMFFPGEPASNITDRTMPEYAIVAHGDFVGTSFKGAPGIAPAKGAVLYALYSPELGRVTDFGLAQSEPNIASLGHVLTSGSGS